MNKKQRISVVKCVGFDTGVTTNGHPQLILTLKVLEHVSGPEPREFGEEFNMYKPVVLDSPESIEYAQDTLRNLGMTNTNILKPEGLGRLKAKCVEQENFYKGKTNWQAKYINKMSGARKELDSELQDEFALLLQEALSQSEPLEVTDENAVSALED